MAKEDLYPKFTLEMFEQALPLTRLDSPSAIAAARYVLVDGLNTREAGVKAGYKESSARSAASRAALKVAGVAKICPCCKRPFNE
jgi:hypothetical protein